MPPYDVNLGKVAQRRLELPIARERRMELETCAYCPRLCRAVCPVSNAEPREALIPWGKMTSLLSTEASEIRLEPWGCTGCGACTELCRHDNPVAEVLIEGRASVFAAGRAPEAAVRIAQEHPGRLLRQAAHIERLSRAVETDPAAPTALLLGCATLQSSPGMAEEVVRLTGRLAQRPVRLVSECCGLIPSLAGDASGARLAQERLGRALQGVDRLIVADPGCHRAVTELVGGRRSLARQLEHTSFLAFAAGRGKPLRRVDRPGVRYGWQPPCWARGSSAEPAARVLLEQLIGEFVEVDPGCTGGGGLVPSVLPEASRRIGVSRLEAFRAAGVDCVVTGCASGARRLRASAQSEAAEAPRVVELTSLLRQGLEEP